MRRFRAGVPWQPTLHSWTLLDSHDTARFRTVAGSHERQLVGFGLQMTTPGVPMLFAGDELGLEGEWGEDARRPMPWADAARWDVGPLDEVRRLAELRRSSEALARGGVRYVHVGDDAIAYLREGRRAAACLAARAGTTRSAWSWPPSAAAGLEPATAATRRSRSQTATLPSDAPAFHVWELVSALTWRWGEVAEVSFDRIQKVYDNGFHAVKELSLDIADGEFMVLVGPSGCGKTTALRMVAGLEDITAGTLSIGGRVVNRVSSKDRDIAMVFQNYALYPHLSVGENIAFGLRLRKPP